MGYFLEHCECGSPRYTSLHLKAEIPRGVGMDVCFQGGGNECVEYKVREMKCVMKNARMVWEHPVSQCRMIHIMFLILS